MQFGVSADERSDFAVLFEAPTDARIDFTSLFCGFARARMYQTVLYPAFARRRNGNAVLFFAMNRMRSAIRRPFLFLETPNRKPERPAVSTLGERSTVEDHATGVRNTGRH